MVDVPQNLAHRLAEAIGAAFGDEFADADPLLRPAQDAKFGDYQANAAMGLAKRMRQKPRDVAQRIVENLHWQDLCGAEPQIAGPGFINLTLSEVFLADQAAAAWADAERLGVDRAETPQTVVVDYSGPNVAKEMHVGHLRSTVIGDALARTLDFLGHRVIRQNHLGDWGTQFGMLVEHLVEQGATAEHHIADLDQFYRQAQQRFEADAEFADRARRRVVALQSGDDQTVSLWQQFVDESLRHMRGVYQQLGVGLNDQDVRSESAYNDMLSTVADDLERAGIATLSEGALCVFVDGYDSPVMLRKSDGGFGYDATDLAALRYRVEQLNADRIVYVTDARQRQHFAMVFKTGEKAGWLDGVTVEHVPFGTILGEDHTPFKTRSGDTAKLVDLLDEAERRAEAIVVEKNPQLGEAERKEVARVVGIGAVKYADLCNDRVKDYVFSWDRMLAMDGNTAPYLQYAYARIRSIFRKGEVDAQALATGEQPLRIGHAAERALVLKLLQLPVTVRSVADSLEPHRLCTYLYEVATAFSGFYENCPVLKADDDQVRRSRLMLCDLTARTLKRGLELLGIEVLERM